MAHNDQTFNPMVYDAMRELETRIGGRYVAWKREAKTAAEAEHWEREAFKLSDDVRVVDRGSRAAIEAKRAELRARLAAMPVHAPRVRCMSERLSQSELRRIFQADVRPYIDHLRGGAAAMLAQPPRFVSVGGQPGAGKGRVLESIHEALPGSGIVNGDELRRFHPDYERLMSEDPLRMPEVTGPASGSWVGMANEYLRSQQASAVVETTLRDATMLRGEFEAFKEAGYETELRVVAVPLEVSRAGTVSRYVEQVKDFGAGQWTPGAAHDEAAANVRETVRLLVSSRVVDRVVVQGRDGQVFHDAVVTAGGIERAEAAVRAVDQARDVRSLALSRRGAGSQKWSRY